MNDTANHDALTVPKKLLWMKKQRATQCREKKSVSRRKMKEKFVAEFENVKKFPLLFRENFRMSAEMFEELYQLIKPFIRHKCNKRPRDFLPKRVKLVIVLEYMATGHFHGCISSDYRLCKEYFWMIVHLVCDAICLVLKDQVPRPDAQTFAELASEFHKKWNLPNCVGAIGTQRIHTKMPLKGKNNMALINKSYSFLRVMAVCDSNYRFTYFDVGLYENSTNPFVDDLKSPHFLVGDVAVHQAERIINPIKVYRKDLTKNENIVNYHLNKAKQCIDHTFSMLTARWKCFRKGMFCSLETAQKITITGCFLHNWIMDKSHKRLEDFSNGEESSDWKFAENMDFLTNPIQAKKKVSYFYKLNFEPIPSETETESETEILKDESQKIDRNSHYDYCLPLIVDTQQISFINEFKAFAESQMKLQKTNAEKNSKFKQQLATFEWLLEKLPDDVANRACEEITTLLVAKVKK